MKQRILIFTIIALTAILTGCATTEKKESVDASLVITLEGNPTTGFMWDYTTEGNGEIELVDESSEVQNEGLIGSPSTFNYSFKGVKEGNVTLIFEYARPWAGGEKLYTEVYKLYVDKDLQIERL